MQKKIRIKSSTDYPNLFFQLILPREKQSKTLITLLTVINF